VAWRSRPEQQLTCARGVYLQSRRYQASGPTVPLKSGRNLSCGGLVARLNSVVTTICTAPGPPDHSRRLNGKYPGMGCSTNSSRLQSRSTPREPCCVRELEPSEVISSIVSRPCHVLVNLAQLGAGDHARSALPQEVPGSDRLQVLRRAEPSQSGAWAAGFSTLAAGRIRDRSTTSPQQERPSP